MAEYTEWSMELEAALAKPFPEKCVTWLEKTSKKTGKTTRIATVGWTHYVERLNDTVGVAGWSSSMEIIVAGDELVVDYDLTILGVTKCSSGSEKIGKEGYGTAATNAEAQAFKRACSKFGIGLYLYDKAGSWKKPPKKGRGGSTFIMPSGQHEGKAISDVPISYLRKVYSPTLKADLRVAIEQEAEARNDKPLLEVIAAAKKEADEVPF